MNKTDKKGMASTLKTRADALLESGINTRGRYLEALPLLFSLRQAAASLNGFYNSIKECADKIAESAATYAKEHATALDGGLREVKGGKLSGTIRIRDNDYTLTLGNGDIKRTTGDDLTETFLSTLPKEWLRFKPKLNKSEINRLGESDEKLLKYGLFRTESRTWSRKAVSAGIAGIEDAVTASPDSGNEEAES